MTEQESADVLVERIGRVGVVQLNRPRARNALNRSLLRGLQDALDKLAADPGVGVLVVTGTAPAFCAGADLKENASAELATDFWARHERVTQSMRIHQMIPRLPKPVIAAVNGPAVAGGCGLAMSCDLVLASDTATFGYPEVGRGLVAAMVMVSLNRLVSRRAALELLLSGRIIGAAEAMHLGMVNRVVPHDRLLEEALEYAAQMAGRSATALRVTKDLFRQVGELDYDRALEYARDVNLMVSSTSDARQGFASFGRGATNKEGHRNERGSR